MADDLEEIWQENRDIGFEWATADNGYYLRNTDDEIKRISERWFKTLRMLSQDKISKQDLPLPAKNVVEELITDGYLRLDGPIKKISIPDDIKIWHRILAFLILFTTSSFLVVSLAKSRNYFAPTSSFLLAALFLSLMIASVLIHEFGHYIACRRFFKPTVRFSFLQGIIPAFITDTTKAWLLPRNRRIWINLAGPFAHLLTILFIVAIYYLLFPNSLILCLVAYSSLSAVVFDLNPLIGGDGYLIVKDVSKLAEIQDKGVEDIKCENATLPADYVLILLLATVTLVVIWLVGLAILFGQ